MTVSPASWSDFYATRLLTYLWIRSSTRPASQHGTRCGALSWHASLNGACSVDPITPIHPGCPRRLLSSFSNRMLLLAPIRRCRWRLSGVDTFTAPTMTLYSLKLPSGSPMLRLGSHLLIRFVSW